MRRAVDILAAVAAVLWSLLAWGAYAAVGWAGGLVSTNADLVPADPELVVWFSWAAGIATSVGLVGVVIVWLIGLALIGVGLLVGRTIAGRSAPRYGGPPSGGYPPAPGPGAPRTGAEVIDRLARKLERR